MSVFFNNAITLSCVYADILHIFHVLMFTYFNCVYVYFMNIWWMCNKCSGPLVHDKSSFQLCSLQFACLWSLPFYMNLATLCGPCYSFWSLPLCDPCHFLWSLPLFVDLVINLCKYYMLSNVLQRYILISTSLPHTHKS